MRVVAVAMRMRRWGTRSAATPPTSTVTTMPRA